VSYYFVDNKQHEGERTEIISDSIEAKRALEIEVDEINQHLSTNKSQTLHMTTEMTGQFENLQELLVEKVQFSCLVDKMHTVGIIKVIILLFCVFFIFIYECTLFSISTPPHRSCCCQGQFRT
jgi:hypothetical protein